MAKLITNVIRDKDGKLVATYETASSKAEIPIDIARRFTVATEADIASPNYAGNVFGLKPGFSQESIASVDPTEYRENEQELVQQKQMEYQQKYEAIQKEAQQRRASEKARLEAAERNRAAALADVDVKNRYVMQTTNNPFVSPGAREISARKAKGAIDSFISYQTELDDAVRGYNFLTFEGAFGKYNEQQAQRLRNYEQGLSFKGGRDNTFIDYKNYTPPPQTELEKRVSAKKPESQINLEKYQQLKQTPSKISAGFAIEKEKPRQMTRAEQTTYNKSLIDAQQSTLKSLTPEQKRLYNQGNLAITLGTPEAQRFSGSLQYSPPVQKQTLQKLQPNQSYVITDKNGNVQRQSNLTEAELKTYQKIGSTVQIETQKYKVTTPQGKERIFDTKEDADKFSSRYGNLPPDVQGPVRPSGIAGSLVNVFGVKPEPQGPNLSDTAFFVGAGGQGYTIDATRPIEPRTTSSDIFGSNPLTRRFDEFFELNKPVSERSAERRKIGNLPPDIISGISNREFGTILAPITNRAIEAKDTFVATGKTLKGEKAFEWEKGFLGIPVYAPIQKTPRQESEFDKFVQGKPTSKDPQTIFLSLLGSAASITPELATPEVGSKIGIKAGKKIEDVSQTTKVRQAAKLTSEGKVFGFKKLGDDTFIVTRGTEGRGTIKLSDVIKPTLIYTRTKDFVSAQFSKTPKETKIPKGENPAQYPVAIIEFNRPSAQFPKGEIYTEFQKANKLAVEKRGTPITITGEVPRATMKEFGLTELPRVKSDEFGIAQSGNPFYVGTLTEKTASKIVEAERGEFIKPTAVGRSAPLRAILKKEGEVLSEYAVGSKQAKSKYFETTVGEIARPESKIIGAYDVLPRPIINVGSKGLDRLLNRIGLGTAKAAPKRKTGLRPFDFAPELSPSIGTGGSAGKGASLSENVISTIQARATANIKPRQEEILFSAPRGLEGIATLADEVMVYPQGTSEKIRQRVSIDAGLGTRSKARQDLIPSGDYFSRYGLETIGISIKEFEGLRQIPITSSGTKSRQDQKTIPILDIGITQVQTPKTDIIQAQTPRLKTGQITETVTTTLTDVPTTPPIPFRGFNLGEFGIAFPGFGGRGDNRYRRKKGKKKYIVSSLDINTVGSIETAGVTQQRVSGSKKIYGIQDKAIAKARKKNQPKVKKGQRDPFKL